MVKYQKSSQKLLKYHIKETRNSKKTSKKSRLRYNKHLLKARKRISSGERYMSNSSYEMQNPFCDYGLSIHCHSQSLPTGLKAPNGKGYCDGPGSLDLLGRRQPGRDYASGQCLAMLRRAGRWQVWQAREGRTDRKSHNQKHETKAKGDGKRRKRENIVKKMATSFMSPYLWLGFHNELTQPLE